MRLVREDGERNSSKRLVFPATLSPFIPPPLGGGPTKFNKQSRSKWPTNQIIRVRYQTPRKESEETWNYNGDIINEQLTNPRRVVSRRRKLAYKHGMKVEFGKHPLARSNRANSLPGALISSRKNISITFRYNWRLDATISEEPGCLRASLSMHGSKSLIPGLSAFKGDRVVN